MCFDIRDDGDVPASLPQNTGDLIRRAQEAGQPVVLTVNGKVELVVQDATSYQKLLELVDRLETIAAIQQGLKDVEECRTLSLEEFKRSAARRVSDPLRDSR